MALNKTQREALKQMFGGRCAYCGCVLGGKWHADHIEAIQRVTRWRPSTDEKPGQFVFTGEFRNPSAERIDNYFPACVACNIDKGCIPLEDWREWLNDRIIDRLRRNSSTFRHAERFGRVVITVEPLVFWFEKYTEANKQKEA